MCFHHAKQLEAMNCIDLNIAFAMNLTSGWGIQAWCDRLSSATPYVFISQQTDLCILQWTNIALENGPFIDVLPSKNGIFSFYSYATLPGILKPS